ncbi:hypothetical protein AND4_13576 [Vibrio sp. AND4]|nr:hypothetical protein AND4_13576 [Vibrio sp. AND4]
MTQEVSVAFAVAAGVPVRTNPHLIISVIVSYFIVYGLLSIFDSKE